MINESKIIVAVDTGNLSEAKRLVKTLCPRVKFFKVGLEMINTGQAPELINFINNSGGKVFYDVKLNDIPNTVGRTVKVLVEMGIWGFTIHGSAGREAIKRAVENRDRMKVIGVTGLTSLRLSRYEIMRSAQTLIQEGVDGLVCSPLEAKILKKYQKIIITPGIRPVWAGMNDHKKVSTPMQAIKAGVDYLVIGRPITEPPPGIGGPRGALKKIIKEIENKGPEVSDKLRSR